MCDSKSNYDKSMFCMPKYNCTCNEREVWNPVISHMDPQNLVIHRLRTSKLKIFANVICIHKRILKTASCFSLAYPPSPFLHPKGIKDGTMEGGKLM